MPDRNHTTVFLGDKHFRFVTTKTGWTKSYYRRIDTGNKKDFPVYTATIEPVAYVSKLEAKLIQASDTAPILSFGANGDASAGTNFVYHTRPFYVSNDRTCVRVENKKIEPLFVYYKLHGMKKVYGFDFHYKATPQNTSLVSLEIPINENGEFDVEEQKNIIDRYARYEENTKAIINHTERISSALVVLNTDGVFKDEFLGNEELFELSIGKRITKSGSLKNGIPIYSANVKEPFGFTDKIFIKDISIPSLLWGIDGIFDWNLIPENKAFLPTDHCGVLRIRHPRIHPNYVYHILRTTKARYGFDRTFRASLANIKAVSVPLPIKDGQYDLEIQLEIANKYEKIAHTQQIVIEAMSRIVSSVVVF